MSTTPVELKTETEKVRLLQAFAEGPIAMLDAVQDIVAARVADAWDAGMEYGVGEFGKPLFDSDYARNPYRATEDQAAMAISAEAEEPMPPAWTDAFESVDATRAHVDELERAIDRVRNLHSQDTSLLESGKWCPGCGQAAPCSTVRALAEPKEGGR